METSQRMMKAMICEGSGGPEVLCLGERPLPSIDPSTELLIKIEYSALNRAEIMQRKGQYPAPPGVTDVIGLECAGREVLNPDHAGTKDEQLGRKLIALLPGGGYASYAKVDKRHVIEVKEDMSFEKVAGIPEVWCTAYQILHLVAEIKPQETIRKFKYFDEQSMTTQHYPSLLSFWLV